jgi:hypothetical protein
LEVGEAECLQFAEQKNGEAMLVKHPTYDLQKCSLKSSAHAEGKSPKCQRKSQKE